MAFPEGKIFIKSPTQVPCQGLLLIIFVFIYLLFLASAFVCGLFSGFVIQNISGNTENCNKEYISLSRLSAGYLLFMNNRI